MKAEIEKAYRPRDARLSNNADAVAVQSAYDAQNVRDASSKKL
ncbi:MAG: hypothetical protein ABR577_10150 [Pyrinomonadaceae bacterium]